MDEKGLAKKFEIQQPSKFQLIEGLSQLVAFDEPPDFEEYSATMAVELTNIMERCGHCCNAITTLAAEELMRLSPWMDSIGGMFPPPSMGWFEWIDSMNRTP